MRNAPSSPCLFMRHQRSSFDILDRQTRVARYSRPRGEHACRPSQQIMFSMLDIEPIPTSNEMKKVPADAIQGFGELEGIDMNTSKTLSRPHLSYSMTSNPETGEATELSHSKCGSQRSNCTFSADSSPCSIDGRKRRPISFAMRFLHLTEAP